ncbi:cyclopropane-fatty-acyl-phospholipid synthase family protein [Gordonia sp. L191]|uniref:cyclopropane-fatty-acyl-phospholipid synthase family protein n=1 Tax=Gordonia sp. L191 TaxID=2982699 RepID=UPI0032DF12B8
MTGAEMTCGETTLTPGTGAVTGERRRGEAAEAIAFHYDVGNDFYRLWLDADQSYSCAMPESPGDDLDAAQSRKVRYHLDAIGIGNAHRILDIGCGWGALLRQAVTHPGVTEAIGLTLSVEQAAHIRALGEPRIRAEVTDWAEYRPPHRFDGIVSVGAFEHFARPDENIETRRAVYRAFFTRCRDWLNDDGTLSLQTIAYANMSAMQASSFMQREIFPHAELPTFADIAVAADGIFEIDRVTNGRLDYAWTCAQWARRLRQRRDEATRIVGEDTVDRYLRYLTMSALGFRMGKICLLRLVLRPYRRSYFVSESAPRHDLDVDK